ncbi:MAG: hypothetical protein EOS21_30820 [Mesorhizobium sp.]|nr:MAG: hypothetical protein EOS21_30820 [Mesorhizobium sp.]
MTERIANLESRIAKRDDEIVDLKVRQTAKKLELPMVPIARTMAVDEYDRPAPFRGGCLKGAGRTGHLVRRALAIVESQLRRA